MTVKNVELLEVTLDEAGGREPTAGQELTIGGVRYRVMEVQPPKSTSSSKWRRRPSSPEPQKWRLLVQQVEEAD